MAIFISIAFVLAVLAVVAYALFELSPFAHHADHYRDSRSGKQLWQSPHLETRDEFERRTHDNMN